MEDALSARCLIKKQYGPSWLEERLCKANGNTKIRTAKTFDYRECHANYFTIGIDERFARTAGVVLRIVAHLVRNDVTDMPLSNRCTAYVWSQWWWSNHFQGCSATLGHFRHAGLY